MATEEWKKEVQKHEQYIKDLEQKYAEKCKELKVANLDYAEKSVFFALKCHWDQIVDIHFFTFSCTISERSC